MRKRVAVTGMAGLSPIGCNWETVEVNLRSKKSGITYMPEWEYCSDLVTKLAAPVKDFQVPEWYSRKKIRSMGRVSLLATRATELALLDAHLLDNPKVKDGTMGVAYGSSTGSPEPIGYFSDLKIKGSLKGINANSYIQMMSHTCAVNLEVFFGFRGRIIPTCSACTSGSQSIGYAYEAVKHGSQKIMAAGGAEELCITEAAVFDVMYATSTRNSEPQKTPRPFDRQRDGLVIGEGACTLILEELDHAQTRGARIYGEIVGFGTNCDGKHITTPNWESIVQAMNLSLEDAKLKPEQIGYVNAHATATDIGDITESKATNAVFGNSIPISSLKGYCGHTLGACGALEAWITMKMMQKNWFAPNLHLEDLDDRCCDLDYIIDQGRELQTEYTMSNNFAFGGINTSLIFKRWDT